jgi:hypothetical protein
MLSRAASRSQFSALIKASLRKDTIVAKKEEAALSSLGGLLCLGKWGRKEEVYLERYDLERIRNEGSELIYKIHHPKNSEGDTIPHSPPNSKR